MTTGWMTRRRSQVWYLLYAQLFSRIDNCRIADSSREAALAEGFILRFPRGDCGSDRRITSIAFICDPRAGIGMLLNK